MNHEKVFVMLKPDAISRRLIGRIISRLERQTDLTMRNCQLVETNRRTAAKWYGQKDKKVKKHYPPKKFVVEYLTSGPLFQMIWQGRDALQQVRKVVGRATNPPEYALGTVRRDFGVDTQFRADRAQRAVRNLVHASRRPKSARREIKFWFS